jgi:hypothetical protein
MPRALACAAIGFSAAAFDGLMMSALTPAEIRLRMSAICPAVSVCRCASITFETFPLASASARIEQSMPSRQPFPTSVFDMPSTKFCWLVACAAVPATATRTARSATKAPRRPTPRRRVLPAM